MSFTLDRHQYAQMFGPTVGDSVRLGDSGLFAAVEKDCTVYGQESKFGGGKTLRDGMGVSATATRRDRKLVADCVITNALIIDYTGIYKADIGLRDGKIMGLGKSGNPDIMDRVDFIVAASTEAISAEGLIVTAGGIDAHVHFVTPGLAAAALDNGITTIIGGGTGPADGTNATTVTPGRWNIEHMLKALDGVPVNVGLMAKGVGASEEVVGEQVEAGAMGIKIHEDWGATQSGIDFSLRVADAHDVQVAIHTDSLNEGGFVQHTIDAFAGRTIHTFHSEGSGGGHAPDIMVVAGEKNILPSSTNPSNPFTANVIDELFDMVMVCHHLDPKVPEDVAFAESRIRAQTVAAEDVLHDLGALSIMSSDAMAMGRVGEVAMRTWQLADKMKKQRGPLEGDSKHNDNHRIKRYIAKYTINPAITCGISEAVGSVEIGKQADLVLWEPQKFGTKPKMVLTSGMIAYGVMGDASSSLPTPQPRLMSSLFGALDPANTISFVSRYAFEHQVKENLGLRKQVFPVGNVRNLTKKDMKFNNFSPRPMTIDPQTYEVKIAGETVSCEPMDTVPLAQRYYLF